MTTHDLPNSFQEYTKNQLQKVRYPNGCYSKKISWFEKNIDWLLDNNLIRTYQGRGFTRIDVENVCTLYISDKNSQEVRDVIQKIEGLGSHESY